MATVTPTQVSPGDEISAASVNDPINQLAAQINGNLDDTNISGIGGTKIATGTMPPSAISGYTQTPSFGMTTAATSLPVGTFTKVIFTVETHDTTNNQNGSKFTAPIAGVYQFNAHVQVSGTGSGNWGLISLYVNGVQQRRGLRNTVGSTFDLSLMVSSCIQLAANDEVELYAYQNSAGAKSLSGTSSENWFNGFLVSPNYI